MMTKEATIFTVSDLAQSRLEILDAARHGRARVRDTDGSGLVMLREEELVLLELLADWSRAHAWLQRLVVQERRPAVSDLGEGLAWLRVFDLEDLREFAAELDDALVAARADGNAEALRNCLNAWRVTARQLEDPLRRSVLLGRFAQQDYLEADRPDDPQEAEPADG